MSEKISGRKIRVINLPYNERKVLKNEEVSVLSERYNCSGGDPNGYKPYYVYGLWGCSDQCYRERGTEHPH